MCPTFVLFTPVPLRGRADGWAPDLQLRFIEAIAAGLSVGAAAAAVGKNRQTAYALRRRTGAERFAAAWDAAAAFAAAAADAPPPPPVFVPPTPSDAEAIARRGHDAVSAAPDDAAACAALTEMLDAIYGPKSDRGPFNETSLGQPNFPNLSRNSVAFRGARLRRRPC